METIYFTIVVIVGLVLAITVNNNLKVNTRKSSKARKTAKKQSYICIMTDEKGISKLINLNK